MKRTIVLGTLYFIVMAAVVIAAQSTRKPEPMFAHLGDRIEAAKRVKAHPKTITANCIDLRDAQNRTRLTLNGGCNSPHDQPQIAMKGRDGRTYATLSLDSADAPVLSLQRPGTVGMKCTLQPDSLVIYTDTAPGICISLRDDNRLHVMFFENGVPVDISQVGPSLN